MITDREKKNMLKRYPFQIGENFETPLTAAYADFFTTAGGQINFSFTRDDKGKIAGFVFNSALDERDFKGITFKR